MTDFIDNLKKNAEVFLEWCRQQKELPKEERDILEYRFEDKWYPVRDNFVPWHHDEYRLRKVPKDDMAVLLLRKALHMMKDKASWTMGDELWRTDVCKFLEGKE